MWLEGGPSKPRVAEDCQPTPEAKRGKEGCSPSTTRACGPLTPPDARGGLLASEPGNRTLVVSATGSVVFGYSGHRKPVREGKRLTQGGLAETCK